MFIEIHFTLTWCRRVYVQQDSIIAVSVGKVLKAEDLIVTTANGSSYTVTVENEKNTIARLIGMRS